MRLQTAIDRVSVERAEEIMQKIRGCADIVEIGTSLIKDFGLEGSVSVLKRKFPEQCILADIKTCDEGEYEFRKAYESGADIATVMGFSSMATIRACRNVALEKKKEYMIDLLEVSGEKIEKLAQEFPEAIFCLHLPSDKKGEGFEEMVHEEMQNLHGVQKIAVAGSVTFDKLELLKKVGMDIVIVGSAIHKAEDIHAAAKAFAEEIRRQ